jgi:hypothetical protein
VAFRKRLQRLIPGRRGRHADPERALQELETKRLREQAKLEGELHSGGPPPVDPGGFGGGAF